MPPIFAQNLQELYSQEEITVSTGSWWQLRASDQLSWQLQLQGTTNTSTDADVYFIDADVPQATINLLKSYGKLVMYYISVGSIEDRRSYTYQFPQSVNGNGQLGWSGGKLLNVRDIDMMQMESCHHWRFCDDARDVAAQYSKPVFIVDYSETNQNFNVACNMATALGNSAIYRNLQLTGDGNYWTCGWTMIPPNPDTSCPIQVLF